MSWTSQNDCGDLTLTHTPDPPQTHHCPWCVDLLAATGEEHPATLCELHREGWELINRNGGDIPRRHDVVTQEWDDWLDRAYLR